MPSGRNSGARRSCGRESGTCWIRWPDGGKADTSLAGESSKLGMTRVASRPLLMLFQLAHDSRPTALRTPSYPPRTAPKPAGRRPHTLDIPSAGPATRPHTITLARTRSHSAPSQDQLMVGKPAFWVFGTRQTCQDQDGEREAVRARTMGLVCRCWPWHGHVPLCIGDPGV